MHGERSARRRRRGNKGVYIAVGAVVLILVGLLGTLAYLRFTGHDMTRLEGIWVDPNDSHGNNRHRYEFRPDGNVDSWQGLQKSLWNTLGWEAKWRRKGDEITIRTDRNWDFVGKLEGDTLRGTMTIRTYPAGTDSTADMVWRKEASLPPPP